MSQMAGVQTLKLKTAVESPKSAQVIGAPRQLFGAQLPFLG